MSLIMDIVILSTAWSHVLLTPYTKVEESFNLHATHDVLMYGISPDALKKYDHLVFPGAVPRSFIGSVLLAGFATPFLHLLNYLGAISTKADLLTSVRLVLATLNALGLCVVRRAVSKRFGLSTGAFFTVLSCTQFHLPFWQGRTLPNMFALFPVNLAYSYMLSRMPNTSRPSETDFSKAVAFLIFTAVVFRAEVALLLGPLLLQALISRWISLASVTKVALLSALISISITVVVDSYFWSDWPLWPELYSIYYNIFQGKASEWGVSPFHVYLSSYLPKLLLSSVPLAGLGWLSDRRVRGLVMSPIIFILAISFLEHKEWRFVVYTVPLFNIAAARGAYWMTRQPQRTVFGRLCYLMVLGSIALNLLVTFFMTQASMANYPGGVALARFNDLYANVSKVHVHIDNLAAQTGASLFLHVHAPPYPPYLQAPLHIDWTYNKTEQLTAQDLTRARHFTHAITEFPDTFTSRSWTTVECVKAFDGFRLRSGWLGSGGLLARVPMVEFGYAEKLCILERR